MDLYSITGWNELYENNHSRIVKNLKWVPVRNTHDGEGYASIMAHRDGAQIFAAWILMLQVASRCEPRGELVRASGEPHDAESLSLRTRAPAAWFVKALPFLAKQGWLTRKALPESELALGCNEAALKCNQPVDEQKGIEGNRTEGSAGAAPLPFQSEAFKTAWGQWEQHRRETKKRLTPTATKLAFADLAEMGEERAIAAIRHSISKNYQGIFEDRSANRSGSRSPAAEHRQVTSKFEKAF